MIHNGCEVLNYERIESMQECERVAAEVRKDAQEDVEVLCVLVDPLSEI